MFCEVRPKIIIITYPEKSMVRKDTCTPVFIAALFTVAETWRQPRCPSTDEWVKKMWYVCTIVCYSAIKKSEIMLLQQHGWTWRLSYLVK